MKETEDILSRLFFYIIFFCYRKWLFYLVENAPNTSLLQKNLLAQNINGHETQIWNRCERSTFEFSYERNFVPVENWIQY